MWIPLFAIFLLNSNANALNRSDLKTGDILLQSVPCFVCSLIELEEKSPYSHVGVAVKEGSETSVLEAFQRVERVSLEAFTAKTKKDTKILVLRPIDRNGNDFQISAPILLKHFALGFAGKSYDDEFLWENRDDKGEKLYCSEFVVKLMERFLPAPFELKPMHYQIYRDYWTRYFGKTPPDGEPGFSPADFEKSKLVRVVGHL